MTIFQNEEFLDIINEKDEVIGKDTRENIWKKGLNHNVRVVNIFVFNSKKELLLPKRSKNRKIFPSCYDFSVGEHVKSGEDYLKAAIRGLKEELGIDNQKLIELGKLTPKDGVSCFMKVYKIIYNGKIKKYDKDGIENLAFYDLKTIERMIKKNKNKFKPDFPEVLVWLEKEIRL